MKNNCFVESECDHQYLALSVNSFFIYYKNTENQVIGQVIINIIHQILLVPCLPDTE